MPYLEQGVVAGAHSACPNGGSLAFQSLLLTVQLVGRAAVGLPALVPLAGLALTAFVGDKLCLSTHPGHSFHAVIV